MVDKEHRADNRWTSLDGSRHENVRTMKITELETPYALVDADRVKVNTSRLRERLTAHGVTLRPHVKTAKSLDVALLSSGGKPGPITVSTLKEAEQFAQHGFTDILYAVGATPNKLQHAIRIRQSGIDLRLVTDNVEAASAIAEASQAAAVSLPTLIESDCDGHRSGVKPDAGETLVAIAQALNAHAPLLAGVMTHAGDSYNCHTIPAIEAMAEQERSGVVRAATTLRNAGFDCAIVSVGSTPTATYGKRFDGITEVRAGVYVFFDLVMAGLSVCKTSDIAFSVVATVIGHQPDRGWVITDAGWMAMSRDRGTAKQEIDQGYGLVCDANGVPLDNLIVSDANQEHGIVSRRDKAPLDPKRFPMGTTLRILPNHACATATQFDEYKVVRSTQTIETVWSRFRGW
jgi:D-serine deaminase-like pyridoxal phosphate-dependent protein